MNFRIVNFNFSFKKLLLLLFVLCIGVLGCGDKKENVVLAKFTGGEVTQNEYIDHYLLSTKYKPDKFPTPENLEEIVTLKGMEKLSVLEAFELGLDSDSSYLEIATKNENRLLFYRYMREEIINSVVTDSLINKFYSQYTPQYKMRYIMRPVLKSSSKEFENSQKDSIEYAYKLLNSGIKFEEVVAKYSQDITTNEKGGDLGFVIRESLGDAQLRAAMDTLKDFSYSKPIRGYEGYYILYKGKKREVPVPPFSQIKGKIWNTLFHTRRHLIREGEKEHFVKFAEKYNYKVFDEVIEEIKKKAGATDKTDELTLLQFDKLTEDDMNTVIASYNGGSIKVFELFAQRKRAPDNISEFDKKLTTIAQQHILARRARDLGLQNSSEMRHQIKNMQHSLLRTILYEQVVKEKVQTIVDSLRRANESEMKAEKLNSFLQKKRFDHEREIKTNFENMMKQKYNFEFVKKNFNHALENAIVQKEHQNLERSENKKGTS